MLVSVLYWLVSKPVDAVGMEVNVVQVRNFYALSSSQTLLLDARILIIDQLQSVCCLLWQR